MLMLSSTGGQYKTAHTSNIIQIKLVISRDTHIHIHTYTHTNIYAYNNSNDVLNSKECSEEYIWRFADSNVKGENKNIVLISKMKEKNSVNCEFNPKRF